MKALIFFFCCTYCLYATNINFCVNRWTPHIGYEAPKQGWLWQVVKEAYKTKEHTLKLHYMPWARAVKEVKEGRCHVLLAAYKTQDRALWSWFSEPLINLRVVLWKHKNNPFTFTHINALKGKRIAHVRGAYAREEFKDEGFIIVETKDKKHTLKMLYNQRVEFAVSEYFTGRRALLELSKDYPDIYNTLEVLPTALNSNTLYITFSKKIPQNKLFLQEFNQGLQELKMQGRLEQILKEYGF